ncbi:hypothetical protein ACIRPU_41605 [Streptomyces sp. NPDC102259]|uniref:hypothetical protein n=1 Tax=Streptomyces sp. NPDC102259 TaxID=3366148 RepID=UPI0037F2636C
MLVVLVTVATVHNTAGGKRLLDDQRSRAVIHWAMANKMSRELTGESIPTWRIETDIPRTSA